MRLSLGREGGGGLLNFLSVNVHFEREEQKKSAKPFFSKKRKEKKKEKGEG